MATTITVTKPAAIVTVHARHVSGHYTRFDPNVTMSSLQDPVGDNAAYNGTSVTFSAGSGTITPTFPAGMASLHLVLTNGHYYRFESSGQVTTLENGDVTGSFTTINFSTS